MPPYYNYVNSDFTLNNLLYVPKIIQYYEYITQCKKFAYGCMLNLQDKKELRSLIKHF